MKKDLFLTKKAGQIYNILVKEVLYMPYFNIEKIFLFPSYDLSVEEKNIFDIYLSILED